MRAIFFALALLGGGVPMAELNAQENTKPRSMDEKFRVMQLIERAIEAGRREATAARSDIRLSDDDRRDVQSQFAFMLIRADRCEEAVQFVRDREEIMASAIERLLFGKSLKDDHECVTALATIMADRWDDPYFNPAGRIALRHKAAVYLDAAGTPGAKTLMNDAEQELFDMGWSATSTLWRSRREALAIYRGSPKRMSYLEEISPKMRAERLHVNSIEANGLLTILAGADRCDLVEAFVRNGPTSCDKYIQWSKAIFSGTVERQLANQQPRLDDESIAVALSQKTPWLRLTRLLRFVSVASVALQSAESHGTDPKSTQ
jgi:hypothetical protein